MKSIYYNNCNMFSDVVGKKGIDKKSFEELLPRLCEAKETFNKNDFMTGWRELPDISKNYINKIISMGNKIRENYDNFVVVGIGGSSLGALALFNAFCSPYHNELPKEKRNAPKFYVEDNIDPDKLEDLIEVLDLKKTVFNVVTKSGKTVETIANFSAFYDELKRLGCDVEKNIVWTTDEDNDALADFFEENKFKVLSIPKNVGGRFSVLSAVGLLPAVVLGIDIEQLLKGANEVRKCCQETDVMKNVPLVMAGLTYLAYKQGKNISVLMPYSEKLRKFADWYCQLLAESIGKQFDRKGHDVFAGITPVKAMGVSDQHSQLQLYIEGPFDKTITFIEVKEPNNEKPIGKGCPIEGLEFLKELSFNQLLSAEKVGTEKALNEAGKINQTITLERLDAFTFGQLLFLFELQVAYLGELMNINAYNQEGVKRGKDIATTLLKDEIGGRFCANTKRRS